MVNLFLLTRHDCINKKSMGGLLCRDDRRWHVDCYSKKPSLAAGGPARVGGRCRLCRVDTKSLRLASGTRALGVCRGRLLHGLLDGLLPSAGAHSLHALVAEGPHSKNMVASDSLPRGFPHAPEGGAGQRQSLAECRRALDHRDGGTRLSWPLVGVVGVALALAARPAACDEREPVGAGASASGHVDRDGPGRLERQSLNPDFTVDRLHGGSVRVGEAVAASQGLDGRRALWHVAHGLGGGVVAGDVAAEDTGPRYGDLAALYRAVDDAQAWRRDFYGGA